MLCGVRRLGKTSLLYQLIHDLIYKEGVDPLSILFVNCDEPYITRLDRPLEMILDTYKKEVYNGAGICLFFDESQDLAGWEQWIKTIYDRKQYRLVISGSSSRLLDSKTSTLISGRYLSVIVYPLDFPEYLLFHEVRAGTDPFQLASQNREIVQWLTCYLHEGGFSQIVGTE